LVISRDLPGELADDTARAPLSMEPMSEPIPFTDLFAQRSALGDSLTRAIAAAVDGGQWINGPQVAELERQLASFAGVKHAVACANGTDALHLVLRAWGIGPGDAVFVPSFTFVATAEAVVLAGAVPVFVDVLEDTFDMNPESLAAAVTSVRGDGKLRPRAVIPVDLFGQPADYARLEPFCRRERMKLLCDSAQSFGASFEGRMLGAIGDATTTSFYPAKPLGCYGDGGACFTQDDDVASALRSLRMHGMGTDRYEHVAVGMNSRLDTVQAAILLEKLKIFPQEIARRQDVAERYRRAFAGCHRLRTPVTRLGATSVWAQYTIVVANRSRLQADLKGQGIPTMVYYPIPLGAQPAYRHFPSVPTPVSARLSESVVSLPVHPYLDEATQDRVINAVLKSVS
jgi:dTDP-4-amino-4,6-dideoxygalactose transaminase